MKDQAINEAIAKACGMTQIKTIGEKFVAWAIPAGPEDDHWSERPPNYCEDLNAMHEAEKTLSVEQKKGDYQEQLHGVTVKNFEGITIGDAWYLQIHATARQRAEAFLRTLNLWSEDATERKED